MARPFSQGKKGETFFFKCPFGQVERAYIEYKGAKFLSFALYSNRKNVQHSRALISVHACVPFKFSTTWRFRSNFAIYVQTQGSFLRTFYPPKLGFYRVILNYSRSFQYLVIVDKWAKCRSDKLWQMVTFRTQTKRWYKNWLGKLAMFP